MLPVKTKRMDGGDEALYRHRLIDLRKYGLAPAAPRVDGQKVLIFKQKIDGRLLPAE